MCIVGVPLPILSIEIIIKEAGIIKEESGIVSQLFVALLQRLRHLSFIINVKEDWFASLNITSKVSLRDSQALAFCNEADKSGDGNGGAVGGGQ